MRRRSRTQLRDRGASPASAFTSGALRTLRAVAGLGAARRTAGGALRSTAKPSMSFEPPTAFSSFKGPRRVFERKAIQVLGLWRSPAIPKLLASNGMCLMENRPP